MTRSNASLLAAMRGWPTFLCIVGALLGAPGAPANAENEIVPEGAWKLEASVGSVTQERAITRKNLEEPLLGYLVPDETVRAGIGGEISRDIQWIDILLRFGISDTWNLSLELPFYRITQNSSLSAVSGGAAVADEVDRLGDRSVSGPGNLRLTSLHRWLFTDKHGLLWGWGLSIPTGNPESAYAGRGTLYLGTPFTSVFLLFQFERYLLSTPGRMELRLEGATSLDEDLVNRAGTAIAVNPGNSLKVSIGWDQEIFDVFTSIGFQVLVNAQSRINGIRQGDRIKENSVWFKLGYGNLRELEKRPLAFPYQIFLRIDRTLAGFNTPLGARVALHLKSYF